MYQFAIGYDNEAGLTTVSIQPMSPGVMIPERNYAVDNSVSDAGEPFCDWIYNAALEESHYADLHDEMGILTLSTVECTIQTRDQFRDFHIYNAMLHAPKNGESATYEMGMWKNVTFHFVKLERLD